MAIPHGIQRPHVKCPACERWLGNDNDQSFGTFCHLREHGMSAGPSGSGEYTCHCGHFESMFYNLNAHICNVPHDWETILTLHQLKEM